MQQGRDGGGLDGRGRRIARARAGPRQRWGQAQRFEGGGADGKVGHGASIVGAAGPDNAGMTPLRPPPGSRQSAAARPERAGPQARVAALQAGIATWRAALAGWQDRLSRQQQALAPLQGALRAAWCAWLLALDHAALQPGLSRVERRQLASRIHAWALALRADGDDDALAALVQRHAPEDGARASPAQADAAAPGQPMQHGDPGRYGQEAGPPQAERPGRAGPQAQGDEAGQDPLDAWERAAETAAAHRSQAAARRRAASAARREAALAQEASATVREVFRRLASALHPDREGDPAERERKTALMQAANRAYAAGDLPALLDLQLDAERVDGARPLPATAQRLQHQVEVLEAQLAALQAQTRDLEARFRAWNGLPPGIGLAPHKADRLIAVQAQRLRDELAQVRQHSRMDMDVSALRAWLREQAD